MNDNRMGVGFQWQCHRAVSNQYVLCCVGRHPINTCCAVLAATLSRHTGVAAYSLHHLWLLYSRNGMYILSSAQHRKRQHTSDSLRLIPCQLGSILPVLVHWLTQLILQLL
jgi:hypothetical protein